MATIIVPTDYATIQAAVDAAREGDIIEVLEGSYPENVNIATSNLRISGSLNTLVDGSSIKGVGFNIKADNVTLESFRITGFSNGIICQGRGNTIFNLRSVFNDIYGINLNGEENEIINCSIGGNGVAGITLGGDKNLISNNTIDANKLAGINFLNSGGSNNSILTNNISATNVGITILDKLSRDNKITNNLIRQVEFGIALFNEDNLVSSNFISESSIAGIIIQGTNMNIIYNLIEKSSEGIIVGGRSVLLERNNIIGAASSGITILGNDNALYNNVLRSNEVGITSMKPNTIMQNNIFVDNKYDVISP